MAGGDHRQDAGRMLQRAVKSKFSQENQAVGFRGSLSGGNDGCHGNRQVVGRAGFFQVGRSQRSHDPCTRESETGIPPEISTSTSTMTPSIPTTAQLLTLANM